MQTVDIYMPDGDGVQYRPVSLLLHHYFRALLGLCDGDGLKVECQVAQERSQIDGKQCHCRLSGD